MEDFAGSSNWTGDGTVLCSGERLGVSCHISLCTPRPSKGLLQSVSLLNAHLPSIRNLMIRGFPGGSLVKSPPASVGDAGSISGLRRVPGEVNGNPLRYS